MKAIWLLSTCSALSAAIMYPAAVAAQASPSQATAAQEKTTSDDSGFGDIVVTATKRTGGEALQKAAVAASAYDSKMLGDRAIVSLRDLNAVAPNVQMESSSLVVGQAQFTIRGLGINSSVPSEDPTVGVFVDGVFLGTTYGVITDTFDLEGIEILRGPQGVLFGRNVSGGAVSIRTRRPDGTTRIKGKLNIESGPLVTAAGSVEGSLVDDHLFAKLTGYYSRDHGYFKNITLNRKVGKQRTYFFRPTFVFKPTDTIESTLIWDHGKINGDGGVVQRALPNDPANGLTDNFDSAQNDAGITDTKWDQVTNETVFSPDFGTFTNIAGYRKVSNLSVADIDGSPRTLFHGRFNLSQHQWSDELRFNKRISSIWDFVTGIYYFNTQFDYDEQRLLADGATRIRGNGTQNHTVLGAFVNSFVDITDTVTAQAGVRYTKERKKVNVASLGACDFVTGICTGRLIDTLRSSDWIPKIGLQWKPNDKVNLYGFWTKGNRSGGYNFRDNVGGPPAGPYYPENVSEFEGGIKSTLFDNLLRLNIAGYYEKITDLQRTVTTTDPTFAAQQVVANVGDGKIKGVEVEALLRPHRYLTLGANLALQSFHYTRVTGDLNGDRVVDAKDKALKLPRFAKFAYSLNAAVAIPLADGSEMSGRVDWNYRDPMPLQESNVRFSSSLRMLNASIKYTSPSQKWSVQGYAKNLLNDVDQLTNLRLPFGAAAPRFVSLPKGRIFGAELLLDF
jgi:iron complex outermembrane receptor protein